MGHQISKEENGEYSNNNNNTRDIKKERRFTTNSSNLFYLYQQEQGTGINYKTGGNIEGITESSSLDDLKQFQTTSLSISSITPPDTPQLYNSNNNNNNNNLNNSSNNNNNNNKSNKSVHFTRTRSRSLNISKPSSSSKSNNNSNNNNNQFYVPNNSYNSSGNNSLQSLTPLTTSTNTSCNSFISSSSSSTSSLSGISTTTNTTTTATTTTTTTTTKGEKIQGRKSKSSTALFKSLRSSLTSSSNSNNSSSSSSNSSSGSNRKRSSSISSSSSNNNLDTTTPIVTTPIINSKNSKKSSTKTSTNSSTESLSTILTTSSSSLSNSTSTTPPLVFGRANGASFSKLSQSSTNSSTDSLPTTTNKRPSLELSQDSLKPSSTPTDYQPSPTSSTTTTTTEQTTDTYSNNNNNLIDKLTDQLHKDPFFNNNSTTTPTTTTTTTSSLPPKKLPPPLPPKNFKPTNNNMNPPTPTLPSYVNSNNNNNNNNKNGSNYSNYSNGSKHEILSRKSSNMNLYPTQMEPTYPSESSSKRSSVELKYLEENHKYSLLDKLGSGTFSDVYLCIHKETSKQYAIKIIDKSLVAMIAAHTEMKIETEVDILKSSCIHPHIIQITDHFETENYYYIVTEILQGGELLYQLEKNHPSTNSTVSNYTEEHARAIIKQIIQAVGFLHSNKIVHRDLKPENILFKDKSLGSILKIIDFGLASYVPNASDDDDEEGQNRNSNSDCNNSNNLIDVCGTPEFQAPEMVKRLGYSYPVDIWSTGIILYILLCGHPPFQGKNNMIIMGLIMKAELTFDSAAGWDNVSESAKDLIKKMLNPDPTKRLTAQQVLSHEWITTSSDINGSPQLGAPFYKQLRRYNSQRFFKETGDTLLRSQRFNFMSPEKENNNINNNNNNNTSKTMYFKRRSIQL